MKKLLAVLIATSSSLVQLGGVRPVNANENEGWVSVGLDLKTGFDAQWIKVKEAKQVNKDSYKVPLRDLDIYSKSLKINCRNKDISFKGFGWQQIPTDSSWGLMAQILCRFNPARDLWGMTKENAFLWNAPIPQTEPGSADGDWIQVVNNDKNEEYYNDKVKSDGKVAIFSRYTRDKKADYGEGTQRDVEKYKWIISDCNSNKYFAWLTASPKFFKGFWVGPRTASPNSSSMVVKRKYCKSPNSPVIGSLPIPSLDDLTRFQVNKKNDFGNKYSFDD